MKIIFVWFGLEIIISKQFVTAGRDTPLSPTERTMCAIANRSNYAPIANESLNYSGVSYDSSIGISNPAWSRLAQRGAGSFIMDTSYPSSADASGNLEGAWRNLTDRASGRPLMDTSIPSIQRCQCPARMSSGEPI